MHFGSHHMRWAYQGVWGRFSRASNRGKLSALSARGHSDNKAFVAVPVISLTSSLHHKYEGFVERTRYVFQSSINMQREHHVGYSECAFCTALLSPFFDHPVSNGSPAPHQFSASQSGIISTVEDTWEITQKVFIGRVVGTDIGGWYQLTPSRPAGGADWVVC